MTTVSSERFSLSSVDRISPTASSIIAIIPQVSAQASLASRSETAKSDWLLVTASPASRRSRAQRTCGGGSALAAKEASSVMSSGSYMPQYLPGGVKGWCGSGNDAIAKNGASPLSLAWVSRKSTVRSAT